MTLWLKEPGHQQSRYKNSYGVRAFTVAGERPTTEPPNHRTAHSSNDSIRKLLGFRGNKANLRDLIAATGLVILLKLDLNRRFFSPCDFEIWWMTQKNNRAPLLCYFKLFASFRSHWWIQTGVTVRKLPNLGQHRRFFEPCDLEIWRMTFKNNRAPLLSYFKLCAAFRSHWWIQTGVRVRKRPIWVKCYAF